MQVQNNDISRESSCTISYAVIVTKIFLKGFKALFIDAVQKTFQELTKWNIRVKWLNICLDILVIGTKSQRKKITLANKFLVLFFARIYSTFRG